MFLNESHIAVLRTKGIGLWRERERKGLTDDSRLNKLKEYPWRADGKS